LSLRSTVSLFRICSCNFLSSGVNSESEVNYVLSAENALL
jgi:hypothetical protein